MFVNYKFKRKRKGGKRIMVDLHSHTTNSDGTWTTKELLTKAEEIGLEVLSITDHDTC